MMQMLFLYANASFNIVVQLLLKMQMQIQMCDANDLKNANAYDANDLKDTNANPNV